MGRQFANLHIKTNELSKTIKLLNRFVQQSGDALGYSSKHRKNSFKDVQEVDSKSVHKYAHNQEQQSKAAMYISSSHEGWISVLHDYFVWGTVKKIGKLLSEQIAVPVMTTSYMNEELFEVSIFSEGGIQAERIFCEEWMRSEYPLREELQNDNYMRGVLEIDNSAFHKLLQMTTPWEAVDQLSELTGLTLWSDYDWLENEDKLKNEFSLYEFELLSQ